MLDWWEKNFASFELGDRRLNERVMLIGYALSLGFGIALSEVFSNGTVLNGTKKSGKPYQLSSLQLFA
ncbi:IS4/Tn5 family transposase DNA-binding protein [Nostoc sp.]|uniref:IS4/Tn5 family transposase DNA-binding protein n=1 Tax=Nostoc sp. TaxID=1180 RepID=UPI002FFB0932